MINKNDIIEIDIVDLNNLGCGVGRTEDGIAVFVKGAVTGDRVLTKIIKVSSSFLCINRFPSLFSRSSWKKALLTDGMTLDLYL